MLTLIFNLEWYRPSFWIDFDYIPNLDLYFYNEGTYVNSQKSNNGGVSEKKNKKGFTKLNQKQTLGYEIKNKSVYCCLQNQLNAKECKNGSLTKKPRSHAFIASYVTRRTYYSKQKNIHERNMS